jgi:hypothetical protein
MRITIHLSTFEETNPCAYAIVWIDRDAQRWSRESHFGLNLPTWGVVHERPGATLLCSPHDGTPLCELEGLELESQGGPFEGEAGSARLCSYSPMKRGCDAAGIERYSAATVRCFCSPSPAIPRRIVCPAFR